MKKIDEAVVKLIDILPIGAKSFMGQLKGFCNKAQINMLEANVLIHLSNIQKYFSQKEICEIHDMTASLVSRQVDDLEKKGLVKRVLGDSRRKNVILLTDTGQEIAKSIDKLMREIYKEFLSPLDSNELNIFMDILNKLEKEWTQK